MRTALKFLFLLFLGILNAPAGAQDFPSKPIRVVVPYSAGTSIDALARIVTPEMSKLLGQTILVENKPGANGTIGFEYVAKQVPADGYTIAIAPLTGLATLPLIVKDLRFDPLKDLPPVAGLAQARLALASPATAPWKNVNELVAQAKANPGKYQFGATETVSRLSSESLVRELGLDMLYVPYSAQQAWFQAIITGEIHLALPAESTAISFGNKVRLMAVTGEQRSPALPDVPTLKELGYPRLKSVSYSLNVPLGTPGAAFEKLHAAAARVLKQNEVKALLAKRQFEIMDDSPASATRDLAEQAKSFGDLAQQLGIRPQ